MIKINHDNKEELAKEFAERIMTSVQNSDCYKAWRGSLCADGKITTLERLVKDIYQSPKVSYDEAIDRLKRHLLHCGWKEERIQNIYFNYKGTIDKHIPRAKTEEGRMPHSVWVIYKLGITVCPYCNRDYIFTRNRNAQLNGFGRCHLDHHKPQSTNPWLALSFYNLVPSCSVCNTLKNDKEFAIDPHEGELVDRFYFYIQNLTESLMIDTIPPSISMVDREHNIADEPQINELSIIPMYAQHTAEAKELIFKARAYQEDYYESLIESFGGMGLDEGEMHRMIFGNYPDPEDFGKRPLAKFTYDLLQQLGVKQPKQ